MPFELYTGARLTMYVAQTLCLPHPKMQLRNQTQRLPLKDWSMIELIWLLTTQVESPCKHLASASWRRLCALPAGTHPGSSCPGWAGTWSACSAASAQSVRLCSSAEGLSRNTNTRTDYLSQRLP